MNKLVSTLHDATHRVPGVPTHGDVPAIPRVPVSPRRYNRGPHQQNPSRHHHAAPRVLIEWQNWIAELVGAKNHD